MSVAINQFEPYDQGPFFHGTKAEMQAGDLLIPGFPSNFGKRDRAKYIISLQHWMQLYGGLNWLRVKKQVGFIWWNQLARLMMIPTLQIRSFRVTLRDPIGLNIPLR